MLDRSSVGTSLFKINQLKTLFQNFDYWEFEFLIHKINGQLDWTACKRKERQRDKNDSKNSLSWKFKEVYK